MVTLLILNFGAPNHNSRMTEATVIKFVGWTAGRARYGCMDIF